MLVIPSWPGKDTCDGITRREILRVGGSATLGISLADIFSLQKASAASNQSKGIAARNGVVVFFLRGYLSARGSINRVLISIALLIN